MINLEMAQIVAAQVGDTYMNEPWFCNVGVEYDEFGGIYVVVLRGTKDTPVEITQMTQFQGVALSFEYREIAKAL